MSTTQISRDINRCCVSPINDIAHIISKDWFASFKQQFENIDPYYQARSAAWLVVESRNRASHPPWDLDPEFTRTHLYLIANLLGTINRPDAKREVDGIRDKLFSDEPEEHPAEVENADLKERLAEMSNQLETARAEKIELEKQLKATSDRLEEVEAEWIASDECLTNKSNLLEAAKTENADLEKQLEDISNQLNAAKADKNDARERFTDERVALPTGKEMEQPVLEFLADRQEYRRIKIIDRLTEYFSLTDDERNYLSRSGKAEKHLIHRGLIERTRTGYYRITVDGLEVLHRDEADEHSVFSNEVYTESQSYSESPAKSSKSQRKWRHPGAGAALRNPTEISEAEAKIARILNPSEKSRLERELREAKRAAFL